MNLYILHYHLLRGGVSRIISYQIESLGKKKSDFKHISIISGRLPEKKEILSGTIIKQELFDYLSPDDPLTDFMEKEQTLFGFLKKTIAKDDIIHAHNPSLGKNPLLTMALYRLAEEGYSLFYHCHDFAEDRPENYAFLKQIISHRFHKDVREVMYPGYKNVHFGVINSADAERLGTMGIAPERIIYLPNPIQIDPIVKSESKEQSFEKICKTFSLDPALPLMIYPVRVIRRKNIGEYILFASIFKNKASWMVTLPPQNPVEIKYYNEWKAFCNEISSPIIFEAGDTMAFNTLMHGASRAVTTSTREGFGMCYLEPWTYDTPVAGRAIPYVLTDFQQKNIRFNNLYKDLPITWKKETKDFSLFPAEIQRDIIREMETNKTMRDAFLKTTALETILFRPIPQQTIEHNKKIIEENYSLKNYGKRLTTIYRRLSQKK